MFFASASDLNQSSSSWEHGLSIGHESWLCIELVEVAFQRFSFSRQAEPPLLLFQPAGIPGFHEAPGSIGGTSTFSMNHVFPPSGVVGLVALTPSVVTKRSASFGSGSFRTKVVL
jgi:hypothetical protein